MKAFKLTSALVCLMLGSNAFSQTKPDSLGLPGDNFDLYGALELFKKADTPEAFEKAINSNDNEVNNLDLDGDGKVDYVKVIDKKDGDAHTLILQVDVSATEKQDVAVIQVEKTGDDKAHVQIVGDEDLYGKDYIIEPKDTTTDDKNPNAKTSVATGTGQAGSNDDVYSTSDNSNRQPTTTNNNTTNNYYNNTPDPNPTVVVNVWTWPSVRYIYGPSYAVWSSPWYWNTYPVWWSPWQPVYWRYHYRRAWHYHYPYYHRVGYYRSPRTQNWYYGRRTSSQMVRNHRESGFYTQKQMTYKSNTPRGQRYNSRPARDKQDFQKQNLQQQPQKNGIRNQGQNQNPVKMQNQPDKQRGVQQKPDKGQMQLQQQPVKQQPVQQPRQNIQPKQEMPKQQMQQPQMQPKQQPMQQQPRQHMQQQSMPKQQMHAPGGGGGHGQRSGGGGRPR